MDYSQHAPLLITTAHFALGSLACIHILLTKKKQQNKIAWIGIVIFSPVIGSITYYLFGINRIKRKARLLAKSLPTPHHTPSPNPTDCPIPQLDQRYALAIHGKPFTQNNTITPLINGDEAFPAMLEEIDKAQESIAFSSYIFDHDPIGITFAEALGRAVSRGVKVYVLLDDFGIYYSPRNIVRLLKEHKVQVVRFLPVFKRTMSFINLRNHRKILLIDGKTGFIGGMNIRHGNLIHTKPRHPVQDIHFRITGPVLDQITEVYEQDWNFSCETTPLPLPRFDASVTTPRQTYARVIPDGPDEDFEKLAWMLLGAIHRAKKSIRVMTPYFLPNDLICHALIHASLRGVQVEIIVPEKNNLFYMKWAMEAYFKKLVQADICLYESPAPFDHSKIFLVDDCWCWVGSSNWDDRSLFLNFEINLECWSCDLGRDLAGYFLKKRAKSRKIRMEEINHFSIPRKLRNNIFNLFSPYL